jgi:dipeptidyl aminopeptidase/acylaminoacyl peptidase
MTAQPGPEPTFDLDLYLSLPRVAGLALAPDGGRLVTSVATPGPDGKKFTSALWELDPAGEAAPRRLTRSAPGEAGAAFLPDGSLLFTSTRADSEAAPDAKADDEVARLWLLPAGGGEARPVAASPAGIDLLRVARDAGTVVWRTGVHPGADDLEADERRDKARSDAGVGALLFETYPIRYWDHYLGPREPRLFASAPPPADDGRMAPGRPLTPAPGRALDEQEVAVTPDGATVLCGWDTGEVTNPRSLLVAIDVASGQRRVLLDDPGSSVGRIACSPTAGWPCASASGTATPAIPSTSACGWSTWTAARAATCWPAWTCGRWSRSGRPTAGPCSSSPTPTAGPRCSGSRSGAPTTAG